MSHGHLIRFVSDNEFLWSRDNHIWRMSEIIDMRSTELVPGELVIGKHETEVLASCVSNGSWFQSFAGNVPIGCQVTTSPKKCGVELDFDYISRCQRLEMTEWLQFLKTTTYVGHF